MTNTSRFNAEALPSAEGRCPAAFQFRLASFGTDCASALFMDSTSHSSLTGF
jgi:hypothetical protein